MITWYFPHWFIRLIAHRQDVRAGVDGLTRKGKIKKGSRIGALDRLDQGGRDPADLDVLVDLDMVAAHITIGACVVPLAIAGGITALTNGGVPAWVFLALLSIPFGVLAFMGLLLLHSRATTLAVIQRDLARVRIDRQLDRLARAFLLPKRVNLLVIPLVAAILFVAIYFSDR